MKLVPVTLASLSLLSTVFAMQPDVAKYASSTAASQNSLQPFGTIDDTPVTSVPRCVCDDVSTQTFTKYYNAETNNASCLAHPAIPNKLGQAVHTKTICDNGGYWFCSYYEGGCTSDTTPKPACPSDTCRSF